MKGIRFPADEVEAIEAYRVVQEGEPSFSDAVRELVKAGLGRRATKAKS